MMPTATLRKRPAAASAFQPCLRKRPAWATAQKQPAATTLQKRPAAAATQKDNRSLTEAISALGRWPKRKMQPKGDAEIAENNLAIRLFKAQKKGIGEDTELASVLDNLPPDIRPNIEDKVMDEIHALGYVPKRTRNPVGETQIAENSLARRFRRLCRNAENSQTDDASQLVPISTERADKIMDELLLCEYTLRKKMSRAREAGDFSTAQIAEIEALKIQQKDLADEIME